MNNLVTKVDELIKSSESKFTSTIAQFKWELIPQAQLHAAKVALTKSDYVMKIAASDPDAVYDALQKSAILGLDLTEGKRQAWLIPRKNQQGKTVIHLQPGYKGVEAIHQRMGVIDRLTIRVVRENDDFNWDGDDSVKPTHTALWFDSDYKRGPIKGAYCITYFPDKTIQVIVVSVDKIFKEHRDISDSWKSYQTKLAAKEKAYPPPWVTSEEEMVKKTMAYIASKQWPANFRNPETSSRIIETLHQIDTEDYSIYKHKYSSEQKEYFDNFLAQGDSLGLYLFNRYVENDVYIDLFNSFNKGEKVKNKDKCRKMESVGLELFNGIQKSLANDDYVQFAEYMQGSLDITHKFLRKRISIEDLARFDDYLTQYLNQ